MAKQPKEEKVITIVGRKVKALELGKPAELLANQKTFSHRNADMTIVEGGVHIVSKKTKEEAVIFAADLVVAKLLPEEEHA